MELYIDIQNFQRLNDYDKMKVKMIQFDEVFKQYKDICKDIN